MGEHRQKSNKPYIFDCAKHRTIKRYIFIFIYSKRFFVNMVSMLVFFLRKTMVSYHKYRQHWHPQTSQRVKHSGRLLRSRSLPPQNLEKHEPLPSSPHVLRSCYHRNGRNEGFRTIDLLYMYWMSMFRTSLAPHTSSVGSGIC